MRVLFMVPRVVAVPALVVWMVTLAVDVDDSRLTVLAIATPRVTVLVAWRFRRDAPERDARGHEETNGHTDAVTRSPFTGEGGVGWASSTE